MKWIVGAVLAAALLAGASAMAGRAALASASTQSGQTVKIVTDPKTVGRYQPATVTVHVGDSVTFQNVSDIVHTVVAANNSFDSSDIGPGASWTYTARTPGVFKYYCIYHPLMHGTIVVNAASAATVVPTTATSASGAPGVSPQTGGGGTSGQSNLPRTGGASLRGSGLPHRFPIALAALLLIVAGLFARRGTAARSG